MFIINLSIIGKLNMLWKSKHQITLCNKFDVCILFRHHFRYDLSKQMSHCIITHIQFIDIYVLHKSKI